jgi:hypothetical protein
MAQTIGTSNLIDVWADSGPVVTPDISKVDEGWQLGEQPPHQFMNWLQNTFSEKLNQVLSRGAVDWNSETVWPQGAAVIRSGQLWVALQSNTNSEPTDPNTNWMRVNRAADVEYSNSTSGLAATKVQGAIDELVANLQWLGTPIGQPFPLSLHIAGVERPPQNIPGAVFIELTAGLDGVGDYNEGLLINEDVDATAIDGNGHVDLRITAEINLPGSPAHGEIVNLINSEGRAIIAGETSGVLWADQMQRITGSHAFSQLAPYLNDNVSSQGAFENLAIISLSGYSSASTASRISGLGFNSANSPDARTSATTDGPTLIKSQTGVFFFRLPNVVGA